MLRKEQIEEMYLRIKNIELYRKKNLPPKIDDIKYIVDTLKPLTVISLMNVEKE